MIQLVMQVITAGMESVQDLCIKSAENIVQLKHSSIYSRSFPVHIV